MDWSDKEFLEKWRCAVRDAVTAIIQKVTTLYYIQTLIPRLHLRF